MIDKDLLEGNFKKKTAYFPMIQGSLVNNNIIET